MLRFFDFLLEGERPPKDAAGEFDERQLAAACLLVEAATMDGHLDQAEEAKIKDLLTQHFQLDDENARELLEAALEKARSSVEWHGFTSVIKDTFDDRERIELIEMLWEVAYADGELHDYEASLLRRVGGLIYVTDRERGEALNRVRARLGINA